MTDLVKNRAFSGGPDLDLKQMERLYLVFDKSEIKAISQKRKEFESQIQRKVKCKECKEGYIRYILYEIDLLKRIKERNDKNGALLNTAEARSSIIDRVDKLYTRAIKRFQSNDRFWILYITFLKQYGRISSISAVFKNMVVVHGDKLEIWKMAANWEFNECQSIENARQYILGGLRMHPSSKDLYEEGFRQELMFASTERKKNAESDAAALENDQTVSPVWKISKAYYEAAKKQVKSAPFYLDLLKIAEEYDFTEELQSDIADYLLVEYPNDELMWDNRARKEIKGLSTKASRNKEVPNSAQEEERKRIDEEKIRSCSDVYTTVVMQLNTERMWSLYLETLIELNQDLSEFAELKQSLLKSAFRGAHKAGRLQEKYYLPWVDILQSTNNFKKLRTVLRLATERFTSNIEHWQMRLRFHLARDERADGLNVFRRAIDKLGTENVATLPLWKILIQYFQATDVKEAEQVFKDGLKHGTAISSALKPLFLEWILLMKGITEAQKQYDALSLQPPPCLDLHIKMIYIEQMQPEINLKQMRKCYEAACTQFGSENIDPWMDYAKFEIEHGDPKNADVINERAKKCLDSIQASIFDSQFNLMIDSSMSISASLL